MEKSPEAFRTISEVADWLDTPAHVLRFWESRFPEIAPVKPGETFYRVVEDPSQRPAQPEQAPVPVEEAR